MSLFTHMSEQKQMVIKIVNECYNFSKQRDFKGVDVNLYGRQTIISVIKENSKLLMLLDENSLTYKSLVNVTRKALKELQSQKLEYWYSYLITNFCSIPFDKLIGKKSKEIREVEKKIYNKEEVVIPKNTKKEVRTQQGITGKKLKKINEKINQAGEIEL